MNTLTPRQLQEYLDILSGEELESAGEMNGVLFLLWNPYYSHYYDADFLSKPEFEAQREIICRLTSD